jgi:hypothetical protein
MFRKKAEMQTRPGKQLGVPQKRLSHPILKIDRTTASFCSSAPCSSRGKIPVDLYGAETALSFGLRIYYIQRQTFVGDPDRIHRVLGTPLFFFSCFTIY